jgi:hypothetical protein
MKELLAKIFLVCILSIGTLHLTQAQTGEGDVRIENFRIKLNGGSKYTQSPTVSLEIMASGEPREMRISNHEDFKDNSSWLPFKGNYGQWSFSGGEGEKIIFIQLKDKFGSVTPVMKESVFLDKTPPKNATLKIVAEKGFVNNPTKEVSLELSAEDAKYMMISNVKNFIKARWQAYRPNTKWNLEGTADGIREVYTKYRDEAGNETPTIAAQILVDSEPPLDGKITINGDQKVATDKNGKATLNIFARGASHMKISTDTTFSGVEWIPYASSMEWKLAQQGKSLVFARFKDASNNESKVVFDEIIWDSTPPEDCSIIINEGAKYTEDIDRSVTLKLKAKGAVFMTISNSADFANSGWIPYKENYKWQLTSGNGEKKIYVRFKDENGNETDVFIGTIIQAI